jgi:predicted DNA-binding ribbon-helix-helix protein
MKSLVIKRSIMVAGRWSSVSLEEAFWKGLKAIAADRGLTLFALVGTINAARHHANLSSAIRLFVLDYYRSKIGGVSDEQRSALEMTQRHKQVPVTHTSLTVTTTPARASRAGQP